MIMCGDETKVWFKHVTNTCYECQLVIKTRRGSNLREGTSVFSVGDLLSSLQKVPERGLSLRVRGRERVETLWGKAGGHPQKTRSPLHEQILDKNLTNE